MSGHHLNTDAPPDLANLADLALVLGEIRGQLRELVHGSASVSQKLDALTLRVAALEAEEARRKGASDVLKLILKSPALGWIVGAATAAWAIITGKAHA
jgi:hypothetical protein